MFGWRGSVTETPPPDADASKVLIYLDEADRIARWVGAYPDIETGGDLFGYWTHSGAPVVCFAIGPGRDSRHLHTSFYQDADYLHAVGVELYRRHGMQHVGEWHSHHRLGLNEPSGGDLRTVRGSLQRRGWDRFLLMIATHDGATPMRVLQNYYRVGLRHGRGVEPLRVVLLDGESPQRRDVGVIYRELEERHTLPNHVAWAPGPNTPRDPAERAAEDVFGNSWFLGANGRRLLLDIMADLRPLGVQVRMFSVDDGKALNFDLGEWGRLLLPEAFPEAEMVHRWPDSQDEHRRRWHAGMDFRGWLNGLLDEAVPTISGDGRQGETVAGESSAPAAATEHERSSTANVLVVNDADSLVAGDAMACAADETTVENGETKDGNGTVDA